MCCVAQVAAGSLLESLHHEVVDGQLYLNFTYNNTGYDFILPQQHSSPIASSVEYPSPTVYESTMEEVNQWQVATVLPNGLLSALIFLGGNDYIEINPTQGERSQRALLDEMYSIVTPENEAAIVCDTLLPPNDEMGNRRLENHDTHNVSSGRKLLDSKFVYFPGCFDGDSTPHDMKIGISVDTAYQSFFSSQSEMLAIIATTFTSINRMYMRQFNIRLVVSHYDIVARDSCDESIYVMLDDFTKRATSLPGAGLWHLLTGCPTPASWPVAGVAYTGGAFSSASYITGVTRAQRTNFWRTGSHELAHGLGAVHSFENGVGKTGGVMDYGNGMIPGQGVQGFLPARSSEICLKLQRGVKSNFLVPMGPTKNPTKAPTRYPTAPTKSPTVRKPTQYPTSKYPTARPTKSPTLFPTRRPTSFPSSRPTGVPTSFPTNRPTRFPTAFPSKRPTKFPSSRPTKSRVQNIESSYPTSKPSTSRPSKHPTAFPTERPTNPTPSPTEYPTSAYPTNSPTTFPTNRPRRG